MTLLLALMLSESQVAERTGMSRASIKRWRRQGIGPRWIRVGPKRVLYPTDALDAWLSAQERAPLTNAA